MAGLFDPRKPATVARAKRVCERKRTLSIFKIRGRLNVTSLRQKYHSLLLKVMRLKLKDVRRKLTDFQKKQFLKK